MATSPLALVTGSSTGIGLEIARELGRRGHDLVLCADEPHDRSQLEGVPVVEEVRADLATAEGVETLLATVRGLGRPLEVAALNAGAGVSGRFLDRPVEDHLAVVRLDVLGTVQLAHGVLGDMVARGSGRVLITSSVVSGMPGPYQCVYNASKAFLQNFGESMHAELRGTGVTVTLLRPGATETAFFRRAGLDTSLLGRMPKDDAGKTAAAGVDGLLAGRRQVVPTTPTGRLLDLTAAVVPPRVKATLQGFMSKPR
ncbi:SDR family NAD(P)-dependent oxidoreductase [Auraticoccus sp. F435]|uniref:SDR family NAD(P)-dependent oxidoreductase n=1 Tax=Auraticoccus cholistanensis TaxID=2656650 RepID=A0A6A9V164_9ACTN|nr:SDR family NAD(P)-dependent oxidoreductase [Auraticoccus cholistanensis]MVA76879.1 SDR family NAD(P)-dependent oxidoreductase [Auraticoccus cholistanensis]